MKPKILIFLGIAWEGHEAAGPIISLNALLDNLSDQFDFSILSYKNTPKKFSKFWPQFQYREIGLGGAISQTKQLNVLGVIKLLRKKWDLYYFNSFFDPVFTIFPLILLKFCNSQEGKILVAPRGELSPGAMSIKSLKKKFYLSLSQAIGLFKNATFHATSLSEKLEIEKYLPNTAQSVSIAANIRLETKLPETISHSERLRVVFLSRIDRKKNLHFAIETVQSLKKPIDFHIYGPVSDKNYWQECQSLIENDQSLANIQYRGVLKNRDVIEVLGQYDLFFLPTLGENFGHAIFDAFLAGTPVLISDKTPWRGLSEQYAGWDLSLESGSNLFRDCLDKFSHLDPIEKQTLRNGARQLAVSHLKSERSVETTRDMLSNIIYAA